MDHKLITYCRLAASGRPLPLLTVCGTAQGRRSFEAGTGTLPMLTATLERALERPVTGTVTVRSKGGTPAELHSR